ncbi:hypothetical protein C8Q77DRAFT_1217505 [Trametes polyzona]|nr:hypothetical protein C8Q77DRAFT_1217505 [Trametes polyzona]
MAKPWLAPSAATMADFRTAHIPLQNYLARIGKTATATCPTCGTEPENVTHFLLPCPTYALHRAVHFQPLGFSETLRPLFTYVNAKGRLRSVVGALVGERSGYPDSDDGADDT